jgi:hypothetical protein
MNYTVDWTEEALTALAATWLISSHRAEINLAQNRIDRLLAGDPHRYGTLVSEGLYALEVFPLRVQFEIAEDERLVTIVHVRQVP